MQASMLCNAKVAKWAVLYILYNYVRHFVALNTKKSLLEESICYRCLINNGLYDELDQQTYQRFVSEFLLKSRKRLTNNIQQSKHSALNI